jgi:hypothetical protein
MARILAPGLEDWQRKFSEFWNMVTHQGWRFRQPPREPFQVVLEFGVLACVFGGEEVERGLRITV